MTVVIIGPVCQDRIIIGDKTSLKVGGPSYFQTYVFEEFCKDYIAIVNLSDMGLLDSFPDKSKVKAVLKEDTHYFVNEYPDENNLDFRIQSSNFADIGILKSDLEVILNDVDRIDAFVLNPLNEYDFPIETVEYLKSFNADIYISIQGFLRKSNDDSIVLKENKNLNKILRGVSTAFMDENEYKIANLKNICEMVITDGSKGSRIISDEEIQIKSVECENIVDTTGCGDTYMAAFIVKKLENKSSKQAGNFASLISSKKIGRFGPFKCD